MASHMGADIGVVDFIEKSVRERFVWGISQLLVESALLWCCALNPSVCSHEYHR